LSKNKKQIPTVEEVSSCCVFWQFSVQSHDDVCVSNCSEIPADASG
jgi:hypothetical protein